MPIGSGGNVNAGDPLLPPIPRRRFVEVLLGSGFLATAIAFLYPVLRYLVPPKAIDLGGDAVVAGRVSELKPNSGKIFRFGNRPGLLIRYCQWRIPRHVGDLYASLLHGAVPRRSSPSLVRLPQRQVRSQRPKYFGSSAAPSGSF